MWQKDFHERRWDPQLRRQGNFAIRTILMRWQGVRFLLCGRILFCRMAG